MQRSLLAKQHKSLSIAPDVGKYADLIGNAKVL